MKVHVITKNEDSFWAGESAPLAVVADATGIGEPYQARQFVIIGGAEQEAFLRAFNDVSRLSEAAKAQAGLDAAAMARLEEKAEAGVSAAAGDTLWLELNYQPGRAGGPLATGVHLMTAAEAPENYWPARLLESAAAFEQQQQKVAARNELGALPAATRQCMRLAMKP
jgi:hypothetical protein